MHIMISRYELSSRYSGIQGASSLQEGLLNKTGNNLQELEDGDLLEARAQWEVREDPVALGDLLLDLDGDNSGDQTVLEWVDLPWHPTWEGQTWVQGPRIIVGVMEMAETTGARVPTMEDLGTVVLDQTVDLPEGLEDLMSLQTEEAY